MIKIILKCQKCGKSNEIFTDIINICECGFELDFDDEEFADNLFENEIKRLFPEDQNDDEPLLIQYLKVLNEIEENRKEKQVLTNIKSKVSNIISAIYHNGTIISDKHMEYIKDLLFSIYNKKDEGTIKIWN